MNALRPPEDFKERTPPPMIDGIKEPNIRVVPGELGRIVDEAELALIRANLGLYQRDGKIVFISYTPAKTSRGEATTTIQILERQEHALIVDMAKAATFERFDRRSKKWVTADPPILAVKALREHGTRQVSLSNPARRYHRTNSAC